MPNADRPYVICHMLPSIDGRIVLHDWKLPKRAGDIVWLRSKVRR